MRNLHCSLIVTTIALLLVSTIVFASTSMVTSLDTLDDLNMKLTPLRGGSGEVNAIQVKYTFNRPKKAFRPLILSLDTLQPMLERNKDVVTQLNVSDKAGVVQLGKPFVTQNDEGTFQEWNAARNVEGAIAVEYVVPVALPITTKRGPHIDLQATGGGISGAFVGFLLLPQLDTKRLNIHVHWNVHKEEIGVTTQRDGDFSTTISSDDLNSMLFMAGPVQTYGRGTSNSGFRAYALGLKAEQLASLARWSSAAYEAERQAFHAPNRPYRFFVRSYAGGPLTSGRSTVGGFMLYLPSGSDVSATKLHVLVAHELVHSLMKDMDDEPADRGDWYTEGSADYFEKTLPFKAGLYTPSEYLDYINMGAAEYYTNVLRDVDNQKLAQIMWTGRNVWTLPYGRGSMYFAALDGQLRAHRSLYTVLDLVNETSMRIEHGAPATGETWTNVLQEKVGSWAIQDWQAMMDGKLIMPPPGAYGHCVIGRSTQTRFFDLGFAKPIRLNTGETISGVVAGSPAAQAGLRDGDKLIESTDLNPFYLAFSDPVTLHVKRESREMTISYDPHSGLGPGMMWQLVPANQCHH